ncbi:MAG: 23S rRNA (guanosine(2251)-2'-O)-methyltransferase RlmB [Verrucomicrobiota bacterium]
MKRTRNRTSHANFNSVIPRRDESDLDILLEKTEEPFFLILDSIQDPHNLGACLRTANAAGCDAVIAPKNRAAGITDTVRHIACGAAEVTPFIQVTNLARTLDTLRDHFVTLVGTGDEESQPIYDVTMTGSLGLVMGAEGEGIRRLTAEKCDHLVAIPMWGSVDCLNVSVATGICLFEAARQRLTAA